MSRQQHDHYHQNNLPPWRIRKGKHHQQQQQQQQQHQQQQHWKIRAPVGIYNLGNTCFMGCVLQCLIHCDPLQQYFLGDIKHHFGSCQILQATTALTTKIRSYDSSSSNSNSNSINKPMEGEEGRREKVDVGGGVDDDNDRNKCGITSNKILKHIDHDNNDNINNNLCIACEMDKLLLAYYGSTLGYYDVVGAMEEGCQNVRGSQWKHNTMKSNTTTTSITTNNNCKAYPNNNNNNNNNSPTSACFSAVDKAGTPVIPSDLLYSIWKCREMSHLAGYEQRDAHEFLSAFLDVLGKTCLSYSNSIKLIRNDSSSSNSNKMGLSLCKPRSTMIESTKSNDVLLSETEKCNDNEGKNFILF